MKSILSATVGAAVMAFAIPAMAATDSAPVHHRHHVTHGKHSSSKKGSSDDTETAKLNEQSLQNAKGGVVPASGSAPATSGTTPPPASSAIAPPPGGATTAPGTGVSAPASGSTGTITPGNAPAASPANPATPDGK